MSATRDAEESDRHYQAGRTAHATSMLASLLRELDPENRDLASMIEQAARARAQLRILCAEHGDNDWNDHLDLADVIEKHLGKYLEA